MRQPTITSCHAKVSVSAEPPGYTVRYISGDRTLLDAMYAMDTSAAGMADMVVPSGDYPDIDAFRAHVLEVATGITADLDGKPLAIAATMSDGGCLVLQGTRRAPAERVSLNLKWSLWLAQAEDLDDYVPGLSGRIALALDGQQDLVISTAPSTEIRFGEIRVTAGRADVAFSCDWDEPGDHLWQVENACGTLTDAEAAWATDCIAGWFGDRGAWNGEGIVRAEATINGSDLATVLARIDAVEDGMLASEKEAERHFDGFVAELGREIMQARERGVPVP